jgi:dihydropteroate synthase
MVDLLRESRAAAVLMHMRGTPATMQKDTRYADLRGEVYSFLLRQSSRAQRRGLSEERIVLDPGLGFGKSYAANVELLWHLPEFLALGLPLLVGASRKGFLGALLGGVPPSERLEASLAAAVVAVLGGASLLRVHDVRATGRAVRLADALLIPGSPEDRLVLSGPEIRNRPSLPKGPSGPARRRR